MNGMYVLNWPRRLRTEKKLILYHRHKRTVTWVSAGTLVDLDEVGGEPVIIICEGKWENWYFVASRRWTQKHTREE